MSKFTTLTFTSLNYTQIYANIVGECAWEPNGCPITFQNYVDFYYGALSAVGSTNWPRYVFRFCVTLQRLICVYSDVEQVQTRYWEPMLEWAATGDVLPYTNFNDWLHYSPN